MKILFAGTPDCAVPALKILAEKFTLCGVLTNPPAPVGRSKKLQDSQIAIAVKNLQEHGLLPRDFPILTPVKLDDNFREELKKLKPDLLVCFAYGKIFDNKTMEIFPLGGINIHPSLLPKWRGCAPVPYAIMSGADETGVTIQTIAEKMDAGNILAQCKIKIDNDDTTESLLAKCSEESCCLLVKTIENFTDSLKNSKPQNEEEATYSHFLKKENGLINWEESAKQIDKKIKAFTPWPGCFTFKKGEKINIIKANQYQNYNEENSGIEDGKKIGEIIGTDKKAGILIKTGNGILAVSVLQKQAKKKLFWKDFLNGSPDFLTGNFENSI